MPLVNRKTSKANKTTNNNRRTNNPIYFVDFASVVVVVVVVIELDDVVVVFESFSGSGHWKIVPKRKCCITGNFDNTSARPIIHINKMNNKSNRTGNTNVHIFNMPVLTLSHVFTPEISFNIGECSPNGPYSFHFN